MPGISGARNASAGLHWIHLLGEVHLVLIANAYRFLDRFAKFLFKQS